MKFILALILLSPINLFADELKTFSWIAPTQYTDGTELLSENIEGFNGYCNDVLIFTAASGARTYELIMQTGDYSCYMTTIAGAESSASIVVDFSVVGDPQLRPEPMTKFKVE